MDKADPQQRETEHQILVDIREEARRTTRATIATATVLVYAIAYWLPSSFLILLGLQSGGDLIGLTVVGGLLGVVGIAHTWAAAGAELGHARRKTKR